MVQAISSAEAIRSRPAMYVGPVNDPAAICTMLQEGMCIALDACLHGCASELRITRQADHVLKVWHNASMIDPTLTHIDRPVIETLLTTTFACRDFKTTGKDLCRVGLVATNALSEWLTIELTRQNQIWCQEFVRGVQKSEIQVVGQSDTQWTEIRFLPDRTIFPDIQLDLPAIEHWLVDQCQKASNCRVTFHDEVEQTTREIHGFPVSE